jgi:hypothetical protein
VLKVATLDLGGIKTPHDFHPFASSNLPPLSAADVRIAEKNVGRYTLLSSGPRDDKRYLIVGSVSKASLSNLAASATRSSQATLELG